MSARARTLARALLALLGAAACAACEGERRSEAAPLATAQLVDAPPAPASSREATSPRPDPPADAAPPPAALSAPSAPTRPAAEALAPRRGLWIWELGRNAPEAERAAALAASWGVERVFIKAGNGDDAARWSRNFNEGTIAPFLRRGVEVWAFGYFYGEGVPDASGRTWGTLEAQAEAVARVALLPGVRGLVVDAEAEFVGRAADATRLCGLLRRRLDDSSARAGAPAGSVALAYTSFGWLDAHPGFPFEAFDARCGDAFLPQVYYAFGWPGGVEGSLARVHDEVRRRGLRAPVWPIQSNERDPGAARLQRFLDLAGPGASVFYLHPEGSPQTAKLGQLRWK